MGAELGVGCRQEMTFSTIVRVSKSSGVATGKRRTTAHRAGERGIWESPQQEGSPDTGRYSRGLVASAQFPVGPLCSYSMALRRARTHCEMKGSGDRTAVQFSPCKGKLALLVFFFSVCLFFVG